MKFPKSKVKPERKLTDDFLDLRGLDTNVVIEQLEESMKLREMPIEKHLPVLYKRKRLARDQ